MSRKYAIFLDIDGTLLATQAYRREYRYDSAGPPKGHSVIRNTGRAYGHIPDVMEVPTDGAIAALGGLCALSIKY